VPDWPIAGANCQESVAASDDRLVRVVGIEMQSAPRKDQRENVPSGSDPLAVLTANADCEINLVHYTEPVFAVRRVNFVASDANTKRRIVESVSSVGATLLYEVENGATGMSDIEGKAARASVGNE